MTAIVYHRVDWDGYTSAAVALRAFPEAELIGWNYGDPEPVVDSFDKVILVDLSLSEAWMLRNADKLVWIDHHKNVIETLQANMEILHIAGLREEGLGACYLAWQFFFRGEQCPAHIKYAATADVMEDTGRLVQLKKALCYALYLDTFGPGFSPTVGDVSTYHVAKAFELMSNEDMMTKGFEIGYSLECDRKEHEDMLFTQAIDREIDGFKACILPIDGRPNACIQTHLFNHTHDVFVCIGDKVGDKFKVSLRVPKDSNFDASAFCRQYGGNGHVKAAGCLMTKEEIESL